MSSNNKKKNEQNLMTRVSIVVIIIIALVQTVGEEVIIPIIFFASMIAAAVFFIHQAKKSKNGNGATKQSKPEKHIDEHSHDRLTGFNESKHTVDDHWKSQADAFLKAGLITKKEHAEMIRRRVSQEQAANNQRR